jgi:hypothetical protein
MNKVPGNEKSYIYVCVCSSLLMCLELQMENGKKVLLEKGLFLADNDGNDGFGYKGFFSMSNTWKFRVLLYRTNISLIYLCYGRIFMMYR